MNVIFIAPPAAGKGTFSSLLVDKYNYNHISAGDVLRDEVASGSELGNKISNIISTGALVDDQMLKELIIKKFKNIDLSRPIIMDGYPRKINQAKDYIEILKMFNLDLGKVIFIEIDKKTALDRVLGRLNCPECKRSYNKYTNLKPKKDGICDVCGTELISRSDDNEQSFVNRFNNYLNETAPLVNYFKEKNNFNMINGNDEATSIFKKIENILELNND